MATNLLAILRLMAVTDDRLLAGRDLVAACLAAQQGGATSIQVRLKEAGAGELAAMSRALLDVLSIPLLVNDRADVALAVGALGVHLGAGDVPAAKIRRIAPPGFVVGVSVGSDQEAAGGEVADYWGIGPYRATTTKRDAGEALGPERFGALVRLAAGRPCVAIGGVRPEDVAPIRAAGGAGVAVVSGIFGGDPCAGAAAYRFRGS